MRRSLCGWLVVSLAMLAPACGSTPPTPKPPAAGFATAAVPALGYLYRDTATVLVARSPRALDQQVGLGVLGTIIGFELSLEALGEAGLDPERPVGIATIDPSTGTVAAFAQITDGARTLAWVQGQAAARGVTLTRSRSADADILLPDGDLGLAVVVRGDSLVVLTTSGPPSVRDLAAVRVASLDAADSVAESEGFRRVMPGVPASAAIAAYVDFERLTAVMAAPSDTELRVRDLIAESERRRHETTGDERLAIERQLEILRALAEGASRQRKLSTDVLGALGGVGIGATFGDGVVRLHAVASPAPGTLPDRLLARTERPLRLAQVIDARPLLLIDGAAEPGALLELLDLWLGARGTERAAIDRAVEEATGRNLGHDLYDNLTGDLGVAITADGPLSLDPAVLRDRLELLVTAGVGHTERAAQLVAAAGGDGTLAWPGFKPLHLGVTGNQLVAATDPAARERLGQGAAPVRAIARITLDGWLVALLVSDDPPAPRLVELRPDGNPTPLSPRYQALAAELERAQNELTELVATYARAALERRLALGAAAGSLTLTLRRDDSMVALEGTVSAPAGGPRASLARLAEGLDEHRRARAQLEADRSALQATIDRVAKELDQTRAADIQGAP